jgi:hypothetical protein
MAAESERNPHNSGRKWKLPPEGDFPHHKGRSKNHGIQPALSVPAATIRAQQTQRMFGKPKLDFHREQFTDTKPSVPGKGNRGGHL